MAPDLTQLQTDIAVVLSVCQDIRGDVTEIKSDIKNHGVRIGQLEVSQKEIEVRLQMEMRQKGIISIVIASVAAFLSSTFGNK